MSDSPIVEAPPIRCAICGAPADAMCTECGRWLCALHGLFLGDDEYRLCGRCQG